MNVLISIALCFLPLLLLCAILLRAVEQYTVKLAFFSILAGFASLIPIALVQFLVHIFPFFNNQTALGILLSAMIINGLIEEFFKMIFLLPFNKISQDEKKLSLKIFLLCSITAGFAIGSFETVVYLASGILSIELRIATAVIMHAACAGLSGIYIWGKYNGVHKPSLFVWAATLHGLYNFFAGFSGKLWWYSLAVIIYTLVHIRIAYKSIKIDNLDIDSSSSV